MKQSFKKSLFLILILLALAFSALGITPARAATFTVTNANDSGAGSLRQAITDAVAGDTITFDPSLSGATIPLTSELILDKNLTIDGSSLTSQVIISGNNSVRVFYVNESVTVIMDSLTISQGYVPSGQAGSGINNWGELTVLNSTLSDNASGNGSAIENNGILTVTNSTLSNNTASSEGTIRNLGAATISNSTIFGNSAVNGGAIANYGGATLTLVNSTLSNNSATGIGGNIINSGTLNYSNTIIANATVGEDCISLKGGAVGTNVNNLVEDGGCSASLSGDPNLDTTLAGDGTLALLSGSSAIDAGDDGVCAAAPINGFDQRGVTRPQGVHCDIGAYEYDTLSDTTAPVVTVPSDITAEATSASGAAVNFTVSAEDDVDGTLTPTCDYNSGDTFPLGTTTVTCSATDAASNTGSASFDIIVEDTTAPDTTIDSNPSNPSSSSAAVFTFSGSDAVGIDFFECQVDGGGFAVCTSGDDFGPLADGSHTFEVRATDTTGNNDASPASYTWTISTYVASQRAKNGGFNTYVGTSKTPKFWTSQNFIGADGKSLTVHSEGTASVRMNGATTGKTKILTQTLTHSGSAGDKFTFSFKEKGNAIPTDGLCRAQVRLYNGDTLVNAKTINCKPGTHAFQAHTLTFTASGSYTQVVIRFVYRNTSGSVWFDAISLMQ